MHSTKLEDILPVGVVPNGYYSLALLALLAYIVYKVSQQSQVLTPLT